MSKVVVFSPSRFSLYTITVAELLLRSGIDVDAIFVRKLINPRRFTSEFSRDGSRLLRKIWKKLVLRQAAYASANFETLVSLIQEEAIPYKTVDELAKAHEIPIYYCKDLNDAVVVENLRRIQPELVVFTGGGLLRKEVLASAGAGVLNCHMGMLPKYRGMDVVEWPILEGDREHIGLTVHFMDEGVDTGDILRTRRVEFRAGETIKQIRDRFEPIMVREFVATTFDFLAGNVTRQPQRKSDGKQYFVMHPRLIKLAESKLLR
jgi:folate-dependent phosphoribosylglycinamide formyltransferase PurN